MSEVTIIYKGKQYKVPVSTLENAYKEASIKGAEAVSIPVTVNGKEEYVNLTYDELERILGGLKHTNVFEVGKAKSITETGQTPAQPMPAKQPMVQILKPQTQQQPMVSGKTNVLVLTKPTVQPTAQQPKEEIKEKVEEEVPPLQRGRIILIPKRERKIAVNNEIETEYSPTFIDRVRERVKSVFEPLFSESTYKEVEYKTKYKPRLALKKKVIYKPRNYYTFYEDYAYEPHYTQIAVEDFAPRDRESLTYSPQVEQESYPVFTYATYGLPDTYIDQYAPEESVKIKPVTEFEIKARPKPLIVSKAHLILLNKLLNEVT